MRYTILGFSQAKLVELGLGMDEAMILRWFVDFSATGKMRPISFNGKNWLWVNFSGVLEDIPIVAGSVKTISRRFERLVSAGIMEHETIREGGVFSCYRICEGPYRSLIDDGYEDQEETEKEPDEAYQSDHKEGWTDLSNGKTDMSEGRTKVSEQKINILDNSTRNSKTPYSPPSRHQMFEEFWEHYPKKKSKGDAEKAWKGISPDPQLFAAIIAAVNIQKQSKEWRRENGQFIPYPATWLRAKGWLDATTVDVAPGDDKPSQRKLADDDEWGRYLDGMKNGVRRDG